MCMRAMTYDVQLLLEKVGVCEVLARITSHMCDTRPTMS